MDFTRERPQGPRRWLYRLLTAQDARSGKELGLKPQCTACINHALEQGCARHRCLLFPFLTDSPWWLQQACCVPPGREGAGCREEQSHRKPGEPAAWNREERQNRVKYIGSEQEGGRKPVTGTVTKEELSLRRINSPSPPS